jgi:Ca-activated chloride channel homolog
MNSLFASLEFEHPFYLFLSLPLLLLVVSTYLRERTSSLIFRGILILFIALALSNPQQIIKISKEETLAFIDCSKSITDNGLKSFSESILKLLGGNTIKSLLLTPFGKNISSDSVLIEKGISSKSLYSKLQGLRSQIDDSSTNIERALRTPARELQHGSILLFSDGNEEEGNALLAARLLAQRDIHLFPILPPSESISNDGVTIRSVTLPQVLRSQELAEIRVGVQYQANLDSVKSISAPIHVALDGKTIHQETIELTPLSSKIVTAKTPQLTPGLHRIDTILDAEKIKVTKWITVKPRKRIVILNGSQDEARVLPDLLRAQGFEIEEHLVTSAGQIPTDLDDVTGIIINNVPRNVTSDSFLNKLKEYTEKGGGVLLIGGDRSFGLGGYINSALEEISPLSFLPPETTKKRLQIGVVLVIDKSRSMFREGKIEGAKSAALATVLSMKDEDLVGVIGFDSVPFTIIRLSPVEQAKSMVGDRLRHLTASGQTDLLPALALARQSLSASPASRRHIIIMSDGKVSPAGNGYLEELARLRAAGVTLSAVALGVEADAPFMQMLSQQGRGAFYHTFDATRLPDIFVRDIKVSTGEKTMKENGTYPIIPGRSIGELTSSRSFPDLRGFVKTKPKNGARMELLVKNDDQTSPLLAHWNYGKGHVVVFTSDANGRWSLPWLRWQGFPEFWKEILTQVERGSKDQDREIPFHYQSTVERKSLFSELTLYDEESARNSTLRVEGKLSLQTQKDKPIASAVFRRIAPGRYQAEIPEIKVGDYSMEIQVGSTKLPLIGITVSPEELQERPLGRVNSELLSQLAQETGGKLNPQAQDLVLAKQIEERKEKLFPPLLQIAFFLLLFEAFLRELGISWFIRPVRKVFLQQLEKSKELRNKKTG